MSDTRGDAMKTEAGNIKNTTTNSADGKYYLMVFRHPAKADVQTPVLLLQLFLHSSYSVFKPFAGEIVTAKPVNNNREGEGR